MCTADVIALVPLWLGVVSLNVSFACKSCALPEMLATIVRKTAGRTVDICIVR